MSKLDDKWCEWCDQPAKRSYALYGNRSMRVYACERHLKLGKDFAARAVSAASGSISDGLEVAP